ncbi:hypothetical protein KWG64_02175 [Rahnella sp. PD12R]|uniref:hypothetical protein n=1 Tax=Rahnella sp. PD12R TaxID=2855688 RepID=UPI001C4705EE|nr:hypothetical protein [Rahnella sp. PD12R]MBV6816746.1 hypothetical protein [Rahnella sp. PD12R]
MQIAAASGGLKGLDRDDFGLSLAVMLKTQVKTLGCHPNRQDLGLAAQTGLKFNTLGSPPKLAQRVLNETLWNPAFFKLRAAARWLCFSRHSYCRENLPLRGSLTRFRAIGLETLRSASFLKAATGYVIQHAF